MRLLLSTHLSNAVESLRSNRMRTSLTMLGVTVGIASMTLILALSGGATKVVSDQVDELGGNIVVIRPGNPVEPSNLSSITSPLSSAFATSNLTEGDVENIRSLPNIESVAPIMVITGSVRAEGNTPPHAAVIATTPDFITITNFAIRDGDFISPDTNSDTAVIGSQLSVDLFGTDQSIGKLFTIRERPFTVIGILKPLNRPINYNNVDFDNTAIISLEGGKQFHQNVAHIQQIDVKATSASKLPTVSTAIKHKITGTHNGEADVTILSGDELSRPTSQYFYTIAATMAVIAGISLIVGGIGIMNIMLVSVAERTREIGIRKALGASNSHIVSQFLIESLAMSISGGIGGYILGYLLGFVVSRSFLTFDPLFSWEITAAALGISVIVGTLFGLYPAVRAARKDPIEALRQYH
ncbi:MAG: ABC transporter permease [Candidatus Saccharimonadales bacterium]